MTGVYSVNLHKHYLLLGPDWKDDIVPEIMDGHNIADFVDADILQRLDELEREEDERAAAAEGMDEDEDMSDQVSLIAFFEGSFCYISACLTVTCSFRPTVDTNVTLTTTFIFSLNRS
jgi:hypothetical protein